MATDISETPTLKAGDRLTREEFLRIWDKLPHIKRAELIGGIVYMPPALNIEHGDKDFNVATWLGVYQAYTPGCVGGSNTTSYILDDCPQPDVNLRIVPECGGKSHGKKYLHGSPELLTEVSASSESIDLHEKRDLYEAAHVQEYLVVVVRKNQIRWHHLVEAKYRLIAPDSEGIYRSRVFPGLWLDSKAFFKGDMVQVLAKLNEGIATEEHEQFVAELASRKRRKTQ